MVSIATGRHNTYWHSFPTRFSHLSLWTSRSLHTRRTWEALQPWITLISFLSTITSITLLPCIITMNTHSDGIIHFITLLPSFHSLLVVLVVLATLADPKYIYTYSHHSSRLSLMVMAIDSHLLLVHLDLPLHPAIIIQLVFDIVFCSIYRPIIQNNTYLHYTHSSYL